MSSIRADALVAAKREVMNLSRQGKLLSPRDAWLLSGHVKDNQTLWSVAFRLARIYDCSAEELSKYLEAHFPQYTNEKMNRVEWSDILRHD